MAVAEAIVICIDDSRWMSRERFQIQCDIIKHYCEAKFKEHEDTVVVGFYTMGSCRHLHFLPTGSLTKILDSFRKISPKNDELDLLSALTFAHIPPVRWLGLPDKNTRILFFVGGLTNLPSYDAEEFGKIFCDTGVAVDVVNFYLDDETLESDDIDYLNMRSEFELKAFVNICKSKTNSHIVDVAPGFNICEVVSYLMLKKTPRVTENCKKEVAADDETWISYIKEIF